jgi:molecular chaperone GrpE
MDQKKLEEKINLLEKEVSELKKQKEEYKNKYLRALADYQNLEKRIIKERQDLKEELSRQLLLKIIAILDDIEKAEIFIKDEGLKIIKNKFINLLKSENVKELDLKDSRFDPNLAEAVEIVNGDEDDKIVEVIKKGYMHGDKLLRAALVKVIKKKKSDNDDKN